MHIEKITFDNCGITVAICEIPGVVDFSESACYGLRYLTANVRSDNRRREIFTVNLLLKELFGEDCVLKHRKSGAPYLEGCGEPPFISISHCRGMVAIGYGARPVGVDIEVVDRRTVDVRKRVQGSRELAATGDSEELNTMMWTAKEALYKLIPEDGVDFSRDLHVDFGNIDCNKRENHYLAEAYGRKYDMASLSIGDKILTIAY